MLVLLLAPVCGVLMLRRGWYRLRRAPLRPAPGAPETAFALALLMFALGAVGAETARRAGGLTAPDESAGSDAVRALAVAGFGAYGAQAVAVLAYLRLLRAAPVAAPDPRPRRRRAALVGLAALALSWPLVNAAGWMVAVLQVHFGAAAPDPIAHETLALIVESPRDVWFMLLAGQAMLVAPVFEEVLYRGLLQDALQRLGLPAWPAIAVASVAFAAMHWSNTAPHAVAGLFVLSLAFGWALKRTGRLTAPMMMHVLFNAGNLFATLLTQG